MNGSLLLVTFALSIPTTAEPQVATDWIIPPNTDVTYDTASGPLVLNRLEVGDGATLRVIGEFPLRIEADSIEVNGVINVSGFDAANVYTLNTPTQPELGAPGGPGGGAGGTGSWKTTVQTYRGQSGYGPRGLADGGGYGGEGGWHRSNSDQGVLRRAAGGGGGRFGSADLVFPGVPEHPENIGLIALAGVGGSAVATGSVLGHEGPTPGAAGPKVFVDSNPGNDFFGILPVNPPVVGEIYAPRGGQGGGAGGDAFYLPSGQFPPTSLVNSHTDKGAGGGGGGGLAILDTKRFKMGPGGRILADGGNGAAGENTFFTNHVGGGSGGGSGGMILIQALRFDLSNASAGSLRAIGGEGGPGADGIYRAEGTGGNGGPGLIQLHLGHIPGQQTLILPPGVGLDTLSTPTALKLAPVNL